MMRIITGIVLLGFLALLFLSLTGCTMSFQNISTHGYANDLVDENQAASPTVTTDIEFPKMPGIVP